MNETSPKANFRSSRSAGSFRVRIKGGTYGWRDELGRVTRMHAGDECEVSETEGARLCSLGIAESAEPYEQKTEVKPEAGPDEGEGTGDEPQEIPDRGALSKLTVAELRELCVNAGMDEEAAKKATKAVCIDFLAPAPEIPEGGVGDIIL